MNSVLSKKMSASGQINRHRGPDVTRGPYGLVTSGLLVKEIRIKSRCVGYITHKSFTMSVSRIYIKCRHMQRKLNGRLKMRCCYKDTTLNPDYGCIVMPMPNDAFNFSLLIAFTVNASCFAVVSELHLTWSVRRGSCLKRLDHESSLWNSC